MLRIWNALLGDSSLQQKASVRLGHKVVAHAVRGQIGLHHPLSMEPVEVFVAELASSSGRSHVSIGYGKEIFRRSSAVGMNKFRKLGFIDYNGGLEVHSSLLTVVLNE